MLLLIFFFFKQKTAYEMRISDWSSDVCSSDLHDVSPGGSQLPQAQDLEGDYLMPGLIELHTDNLEKYMNPRPGVDWPSESAVLAHDAQIVSAGIRSEEHTSELQSLMRISYAVFCLKKKKQQSSHNQDKLK